MCSICSCLICISLQLHGGLTMLISSREEERLVEKGLKAFGEAAVYFGGPYELNNPGLRARERAQISPMAERLHSLRLKKNSKCFCLFQDFWTN